MSRKLIINMMTKPNARNDVDGDGGFQMNNSYLEPKLIFREACFLDADTAV